MLDKKFFERDSHEVARSLLGSSLVRVYPSGKKKVGKIVEVEVYQGPNDMASHAARKKTQRNEVMFGGAGHYYVYLIYGMYYCLNIVTEESDYPAAILIRSLEPISDAEKDLDILSQKDKQKLASGPGKLCRWLDIDKSLSGASVDSESLYVEIASKIPAGQIVSTERVGVDYAGESAKLEWRYYVLGNEYVSKK